MKNLFLAALTLVFVSACSTVEMVNEYMPWYSGNSVESVGLKVNTGTAMNYAVSVDIVFAYDENLVTLLTSTSSDQWFKERQGYIASYGVNMDVIQRQIVPGYSELLDNFSERSALAKGVFAFAYYPNNPNAKAVLTEVATPWLVFDAAQMTMVSAAPGGATEDQE
ncbi:hypothetical protein [Planctobacterium marinum]|uniref:Lipoprotein n=1 Tax=Planctobacterium marinum TaxID=1631968 RepID=A0AA48KPE1_9ALTE|nr:hypothetical protein MACH26_20770 [Planctobacterium marinum]